MEVSYTNYKREVRLISKKLGIKVKFSKNTEIPFCRIQKREIVIPSTPISRDNLISIFFHEYSHQVCYDLHIYDNYHRGNVKSKGFYRVMADAEIYVDKMGRDFTRLYDKNIEYYGAYMKMSKREIKKFLSGYYKI